MDRRTPSPNGDKLQIIDKEMTVDLEQVRAQDENNEEMNDKKKKNKMEQNGTVHSNSIDEIQDDSFW